jgi:Baseplate J-like protein
VSDYVYPPVESSPVAIKARFNQSMEADIEGWEPDPAELDDKIASAFSQIIAQLEEANSDAATSIFRWFGANIVGIQPDEAKPAKGLTTWTAVDNKGYTFPSGSAVIFVDGSGKRQIFETTSEVVIAKETTSVTGVAVVAQIPGAEGNGVTGTASEFITPFDSLTTVTLQEATSEGVEAESDAAYLTRLKEEFEELTPKAITPEDFEKIALNSENIGRAVCFRGWNPEGTESITGTVKSGSKEITEVSDTTKMMTGSTISGAGITGKPFIMSIASGKITISSAATENHSKEALTLEGTLGNAGYVGLYVADKNGKALSSPEMKTEEETLSEKTLPGVKVTVNAPLINNSITIVAEVFVWPGQNTVTGKTAVEEALSKYISPATFGRPSTGQANEWSNEPVLRYASVEHAILSIPSVHYIASMTLNGGKEDVLLEGVAPLPEISSQTITVKVG